MSHNALLDNHSLHALFATIKYSRAEGGCREIVGVVQEDLFISLDFIISYIHNQLHLLLKCHCA